MIKRQIAMLAGIAFLAGSCSAGNDAELVAGAPSVAGDESRSVGDLGGCADGDTWPPVPSEGQVIDSAPWTFQLATPDWFMAKLDLTGRAAAGGESADQLTNVPVDQATLLVRGGPPAAEPAETGVATPKSVRIEVEVADRLDEVPHEEVLLGVFPSGKALVAVVGPSDELQFVGSCQRQVLTEPLMAASRRASATPLEALVLMISDPESFTSAISEDEPTVAEAWADTPAERRSVGPQTPPGALAGLAETSIGFSVNAAELKESVWVCGRSAIAWGSCVQVVPGVEPTSPVVVWLEPGEDPQILVFDSEDDLRDIYSAEPAAMVTYDVGLGPTRGFLVDVRDGAVQIDVL